VKNKPLLERWRETVELFGNSLALRELASGRSWTFQELARAAGSHAAKPGLISYPQGHFAEFILDILKAWESGQIVCPLEAGQPKPRFASPVPPEIAHLKTTSATTDAPRLVAFTAEQLIADARNIVTTMGLRHDWPNLGVISLAHSYGFSNLVLPLLLHGIPLMLVPAALPETVRSAAQNLRAITLPAVPALWRAWNEAGIIPGNIKLAISAGAPLPLPLEKEIHFKYGLKLHNFYGSSECGGIAYDDSDEPRSDSTCIGIPMQNVELTIGEDGCLVVAGDAVGATYWPEPSPNLGGGVFRTSDLAEIESGLVYFRGRACDRINVAGRKVAPEMIERVLAAHPEVRECLAFGVPTSDSGRGETIVACVVRRGAVTAEALKQFSLERLPPWQVPREWWLVESLEVNQRGKLPRNEMRRAYLESRANKV
jgi:acyl-CoA synthetase (AMP-forming)/AMP-acid ligase II